MKCIKCNQVPQLCKCVDGEFVDNKWWEDDQQDRAPFTEAVDTIKQLQADNAALRQRLETEKAKNGLHCNCGNSEFKCLVCEAHVNTFGTTVLLKKLYAREEALRQRLALKEQELANLREDFIGRLKPVYDYVDGIAVSVAEDEIDRLQQRLARLVEDLKIVVVERKEKFSSDGACSIFIWKRIESAIADAKEGK